LSSVCATASIEADTSTCTVDAPLRDRAHTKAAASADDTHTHNVAPQRTGCMHASEAAWEAIVGRARALPTGVQVVAPSWGGGAYLGPPPP
jgi:hypothetical protein